MQNVMQIATNAGHTTQNDGRNTLNVCEGPKGEVWGAPEKKTAMSVRNLAPGEKEFITPVLQKSCLKNRNFKEYFKNTGWQQL